MLALEFKPTKQLDRPSVPDSESFFQKGLSYEKGIDTEKDTVSALEWYLKAADLGHEEAMLRIQLLQPKHPPAYVTEYPGYTKETLDLLSNSLAGDSAAQFKLGLRYSNGKGAPKDSTEAVKWYLKSAEQGEPAAMNNLALKYKAGDGVEKNITEAFKWCLKSANKGFGIAQFNLADFYEKGIGVAADLNLAIEWHKKAAAQGEKDSILKLQKLGSAPKPAFQNYLDQAKSVLN
jgi:TPR repeat protein